MVSLKERYKDKVKFYFIEYNQEEALPVINRFNIKSHPQTFFLDKNDNLIDTTLGFSKELTRSIEIKLLNLIKE